MSRGSRTQCSCANVARNCATSPFAAEITVPAFVSWTTGDYVYPSRVRGAERHPVTRTAIGSLLREVAPAAAPVPADVLAAARAEGMHLLLADRLRLPVLDEELREAAVVEALRAHELRTVLARLPAGV